MLKKLAFATAFLALCATPAAAVDITLDGTVASTCVVDASATAFTFSSLSDPRTMVATLTYTCNSPTGFTRTVSSANDGRLMQGATQGPTYQVDHDGTLGIALALTSPTTAGVATVVPQNDAYLTGHSGDLYVTLGGGGSLYAGTYTDTLQITIAP